MLKCIKSVFSLGCRPDNHRGGPRLGSPLTCVSDRRGKPTAAGDCAKAGEDLQQIARPASISGNAQLISDRPFF